MERRAWKHSSWEMVWFPEFRLSCRKWQKVLPFEQNSPLGDDHHSTSKIAQLHVYSQCHKDVRYIGFINIINRFRSLCDNAWPRIGSNSVFLFWLGFRNLTCGATRYRLRTHDLFLRHFPRNDFFLQIKLTVLRSGFKRFIQRGWLRRKALDQRILLLANRLRNCIQSLSLLLKGADFKNGKIVLLAQLFVNDLDNVHTESISFSRASISFW